MQSATELIELRVFLARHKLRQEDLAVGTGLSRISIGRIIAGEASPRKANVDAILGFCRKFDPAITYEQLFSTSEHQAAPQSEQVAS